MTLYWFWWGIACFLLVLELMTFGGFLLWIALSAALVGLLAWLTPVFSLPWQATIFSILAVSSAFLWRYYLQKNPKRSANPTLNRRAEQYIGRIVTLSEAIQNGQGRIHVDDTVWRVEGQVDMPIGSRVKIIGVDGTILKIKAISE